jgi:hypothetical protein
VRFLLSTALILFMSSRAAFAQGSNDCSTIVKSAQDAANKADWVIEGTVDNTFRMKSSPRQIGVFVENVKILYEAEHSSRFSTAMLETDFCFPNATTTLWGPAANKLVGKRVRFFGSRGTSGRGRRFFFMQTAEQAMPAFQTTRKTYADKESIPLAKKLPDGWSRIRSTDGNYSIDMPGTATDITRGSGPQPAFMLRGTDQYGSTFIVVFERSGAGAQMAGTVDATISKPGADVITFKGADAVSTLGELPGSAGAKISHGLWLRVPGGTYMLGIVTDKEHETESLKAKERFFNSLTFE